MSSILSAQNLWDNSFPLGNTDETFLAMADFQTDKIEYVTKGKTGRTLFYEFNSVVEEELQLEEWMTNEVFFNTNNYFNLETDNPIVMEEWMVDEDNFNKNFTINDDLIIPEPEKALEIKEWMFDENVWRL